MAAKSPSAAGVTLKAAVLNKFLYDVIHQEELSKSTIYVPKSDEMIVEHEGWAEKHGFSTLNSWKRRYFSLKKTKLTYSKFKGGKSRGEIKLTCLCRVMKLSPGQERHPQAALDATKLANRFIKRSNGILLIVPERGRAFEFFCDSEEERNAWLHVLSHNLEIMLKNEDNVKELVGLLLELTKSSQVAGEAKMLLRSRHLPVLVEDTQSSGQKDEENPDFFTQLLVLAKEGNVSQLKTLFAAHSKGGKLDFDIDRKTENRQASILHVAARFRQKEVLQWTLANGADPNTQDIQGDTPLHIAIRLGDHDSVKILMEFGVSLDTQNIFEETVISEATFLKMKRIRKDLLAYAKRRNTVSQLLSLSDTTRCPKCKTLIPSKSKFCLLCGLNLELAKDPKFLSDPNVFISDSPLPHDEFSKPLPVVPASTNDAEALEVIQRYLKRDEKVEDKDKDEDEDEEKDAEEDAEHSGLNVANDAISEKKDDELD